MSENIILVSEDQENIKYIKEKLLLLRQNDNILVCSVNNLKKNLTNPVYDIALIDESQYNRLSIIKIIETIKNASANIEILIVNSEETDEFMSECVDRGASGYIKFDSTGYDYRIQVLNCLKRAELKEKIILLNAFLSNTVSVVPKNGLITHKALKESFSTLAQNPKIRNGVFAVLSLDEKTKTKISMNRLAGIITKTLSDADIAASALGYFYIIFENSDINSAKYIIEKIDNKMGDEFEIHAGLTEIKNRDYDTVEKFAKDSLKVAVNENELTSYIGYKSNIENVWLSEDGKDKQFKIFKLAFDKKLKNIIEPAFYRFEKDCNVKMNDCTISQYANSVECNFTIKKDNFRSELILRHDGFATLKINIMHTGLDSSENSDYEIKLNKFTEKEMNKLLKQLKTEFISAIQ